MIDVTSNRFGRLVARRPTSARRNRSVLWECICDCGASCVRSVRDLRSGHTRSCGCLNEESRVRTFTKHGMHASPEWRVWKDMKRRCLNPSAKNYHRYGGRGIHVCDRWLHDFSAFYADMGPRPSPDYSIERKDNNGNYEPANCKWATVEEQNRNTTRNRWIELDGVRRTVSEWARALQVDRSLIRHRLDSGWEPRDAVMSPSQRAN